VGSGAAVAAVHPREREHRRPVRAGLAEERALRRVGAAARPRDLDEPEPVGLLIAIARGVAPDHGIAFLRAGLDALRAAARR
jgi:hypothetical protein